MIDTKLYYSQTEACNIKGISLKKFKSIIENNKLAVYKSPGSANIYVKKIDFLNAVLRGA
ncbi:hypothetical protein [Pedobacter foliorum]|uniref:hypothetical protein n=1 Tax=Pedobacter foliorum TaxID=2739058 RepID=UPI001567C294|nr:hypothetical protein [Pedobacter foliorum]NRF39558.1 hypothetical protein [Pedobacter foliorum]